MNYAENEEKKLFMVFDVESIGLHGQGFAVGIVVVDEEGKERDAGVFSCDPDAAAGDEEGRKWVQKNVPELFHTHLTTRDIRQAFWSIWLTWKDRGATLVSDCAWPVETRFLAQCVADASMERAWEGPYPLIDLSSILLAAGVNPTQEFDRRENELPKHDPLADARQSARILVHELKCLKRARKAVCNDN